MGYYIDLDKITIDEYKVKLKTAYLPPSRMMLRENPDERFGYFKSIGINNVQELLQLLKKKDRLDELSKVGCLAGDYLKILLRELNSLLPKPNNIRDFTGISPDTVQRLEKAGIKNTVKLYSRIVNKANRAELAETTGIREPEITVLTKLTDLSRIRWVGATTAQMLHDIGFDTVKKVSEANGEDLHEKINRLNKERSIFKGHIGLNDIHILIDTAKEVPFDIEY